MGLRAFAKNLCINSIFFLASGFTKIQHKTLHPFFGPSGRYTSASRRSVVI